MPQIPAFSVEIHRTGVRWIVAIEAVEFGHAPPGQARDHELDALEGAGEGQRDEAADEPPGAKEPSLSSAALVAVLLTKAQSG